MPCRAVPQTQLAWQGVFEQALDQLRNGDVAAATTKFEAIWKSHSREFQLAHQIGTALDMAGHHAEATRWYQRALAIQPGYEPALNNLALNYATLGELTKATPLLHQALRVNPGNAQAAYNLGLMDLRLERYADAVEAFRIARQAPRPPAPAERIELAEATALFRLGRYSETVNVLNRSGTQNEAVRLELLGSAQALAGDLPSAVKTFQQAADWSSGNPQVYYRLALVFMLGRRDQEAQDVLAAGLKNIPSSPLLLYAQAVVNEAIGTYEEAARLAEKSLQGDRKQPEVWGLLGSLYARLRRNDDAIKAYQQALALGAGPRTCVDYAELLIRLERFKEAEKQLRVLVERYPHDARVNRGMGKLYREQNQYSRAETYLERAVKINPDDAEAHFALGETFRHLGRLDAAKREYAAYRKTKDASRMVRVLELAGSAPEGPFEGSH